MSNLTTYEIRRQVVLWHFTFTITLKNDVALLLLLLCINTCHKELVESSHTVFLTNFARAKNRKFSPQINLCNMTFVAKNLLKTAFITHFRATSVIILLIEPNRIYTVLCRKYWKCKMRPSCVVASHSSVAWMPSAACFLANQTHFA